jgi:hypothetical protein
LNCFKGIQIAHAKKKERKKKYNLSPTPPSILIENTASINKTIHD